MRHALFAAPAVRPVDQAEQKRTGHRPVEHIPFLIDFQIDEGLQGAIIIQEIQLGRPFCELIERKFVEIYHGYYRMMDRRTLDEYAGY